jgi:hypothetical protein
MSDIDTSKPVEGFPTTLSVRENFQIAADEIDANAAAIAVNAAAIVVNAGDIAAGAFPNYLAGYESSGNSMFEYAGDLDAVVVNSAYFVRTSAVTNGPDIPDGNAILITYLVLADAAIQYWHGRSGYSGKIWQREMVGGVWDAEWVLIVDGPAQTMLRTDDRLDITSVPVP